MYLQPRRKRTRNTFARTAGLFAATAAAVLASACNSDTISAPAAAPAVTEYQTGKFPIGGVLKALFPMAPLTRDEPLEEPIVRTFKIGKGGGKLEIKETGLRVDIPAGAIPGNSLTITVTALAGSAVAYDFQPHGTVFQRALDFQQDLKNTSWNKSGFKGTAVGGYFENTAQLNMLSGLSLLDELFAVTLDDKKASFDIKHFSGYMVSSGRQEITEEQF